MRQKRRSLLVWVGVALVSVVLGAAIFGPFIAPFGPNETLGRPYSDPSAFPPFGLDYLGRDVASRLLWGGRTALFLALVSTVLGLALAVIPALLAAFHRGWVDAIFNRTSELLLSFPIIVLVLLLVAGFGTSLWLVVAAVAVGHAPRFARLVRGSAMAQRDLGYVEVAEARGESSLYIVPPRDLAESERSTRRGIRCPPRDFGGAHGRAQLSWSWRSTACSGLGPHHQ